MFTAGPSMSTCSVDNFIRRLHATALSYGLVINFNNAATTETPSVVSSKVADLEAAGWTITDNTTDATIPFQYGAVLEPDTTITPTNNTGSAFTGTFTSTNSNIAVNSTTGVINTSNTGNATIRYTLPDGCFTEQAISVASYYFAFEIDTSLYSPADLVQGFGFYYSSAYGSNGGWTTGTFDIDWGDSTSETLGYTDAYQRNGTWSMDFRHTYTTGGIYTIKVDFTNAWQSSTDAIKVGLAGFSTTGGNGAFEINKKQRITKFKSFGTTGRYSSFHSFWYQCQNLETVPNDTATIHTGYVDNLWHKGTIQDCFKIPAWKSSYFGMNQTPARYSTSNRSFSTWKNAYDIEEIELTNVHLAEGYTAWPDAPSINVGLNVANGTKVTWDNITVDNISSYSKAGSFTYVLGYGQSNNKLHKDSMFRNVTIGTMSSANEGLSVNVMSGATMIAAANATVSIDYTNWKMADNSALDVGRSAFAWLPKIQDTSGNTAQNTFEIDLTSSSQWKLEGSYQSGFNTNLKIGGNRTHTITGTANWDITGVTSWSYFSWSNNAGTKFDMDISGWEVWNTASMGTWMNGAGLTTSQYDAALIAWDSNVPGSASAVSIRLGTSQYTEGGTAEAARTRLIETHGWTITDGGPA